MSRTGRVEFVRLATGEAAPLLRWEGTHRTATANELLHVFNALIEAIEPFAEWAELADSQRLVGGNGDADTLYVFHTRDREYALRLGDIRRAARALRLARGEE